MNVTVGDIIYWEYIDRTFNDNLIDIFYIDEKGFCDTKNVETKRCIVVGNIFTDTPELMVANVKKLSLKEHDHKNILVHRLKDSLKHYLEEAVYGNKVSLVLDRISDIRLY